MRRPPERVFGLAASFVATVAVTQGCKDGKSPDEVHTSPPSLHQRADGSCSYMVGFSCPPEATCNPPPPMPAECPADMADGGARLDSSAPERPGWVRILPELGAYNGSCSFFSDYFCPHPGKTEGACEQQPKQELSCRFVPYDTKPDAIPEGGQPGWHFIERFTAKRAGGVCVRYDGFWCERGCDLPAGTHVDCASGAAIATAAPSVTATVAASATATATIASAPVQLNPRDGDGRAIRVAWNGEGCFVYLPFPPLGDGARRPKGTAPPQRKISCPDVMKSETFQQCRGGAVQRKDDSCTCFVGGNPPPPPRPVPCPSE